MVGCFLFKKCRKWIWTRVSYLEEDTQLWKCLFTYVCTHVSQHQSFKWLLTVEWTDFSRGRGAMERFLPWWFSSAWIFKSVLQALSISILFATPVFSPYKSSNSKRPITTSIPATALFSSEKCDLKLLLIVKRYICTALFMERVLKNAL